MEHKIGIGNNEAEISIKHCEICSAFDGIKNLFQRCNSQMQVDEKRFKGKTEENITPDSEAANRFYHIGVMHQSKGELDLAIQNFKSSLHHDPSKPEPRFCLGHLLQNRLESMIKVNLGNIKLAQGETGEALTFFTDATILNPGNASAWINLAVIYHQTQHYDLSIACSTKAISIDPKDGTAYYNLACTFHDIEHFEDAIQMYNAAILCNPMNSEIFYNLGIAFEQLGKRSEAIQAYKRAHFLAPSFEEAVIALEGLSNSQNDIHSGPVGLFKKRALARFGSLNPF